MPLEAEVKRYASNNGYEVSTFETLACPCGSGLFKLFSDDEEGSAVVDCAACNRAIDIQQSEQYAQNLVHNICHCDNGALQIGVGLSAYARSADVNWIYVGAHCGKCGLSGVYADWKAR